MQTKILEIRDSATFIPVLCVDMNAPQIEEARRASLLGAENDAERYYLRRCGYPNDGEPNILLTRLDGNGQATNDPYAWGGRTYPVAHQYIIDHWRELKSGDVVDVEFILGERAGPKFSERFRYGLSPHAEPR